MRIFFVCTALFWAAHTEAQAPVQPGDIIFHRSRSSQSRVIEAVTNSPWTHVGVVFHREGEPWVLEAVQPVRWTRLRDWIRRGRGGVYTIRRPRGPLSTEALDSLRERGEAFLGRRYDNRFEWNEERIYCSELVWLIFEQALGLRLVEPQSWRQLTLTPAARRLARRRLGGLPPQDALIVTPASLLASPLLYEPAAE